MNAIKGLAGTRHGEAAGLRWQNYFPEVKPLGKLVIARSYNKDGTKTKVARLVPVHVALAQLLDDWRRSGWPSVYARSPGPEDLIVPRSVDDPIGGDDGTDDDDDDEMWQADEANKLFLADLEALGMRRRRGHDLRRTFITLAQEDGARRDVLQVITHAPNPADVMSLYTSYPWSTLCAEVAKLQIALPEPRQARAVPSRPGPDPERAAQATPPQSALLSLLSTAPAKRHTQQRPTEPHDAAAPARAEAPGAAGYLRRSRCSCRGDCSATCSATPSAENPMFSSRCPGLNRGPTVYETVALPLSYSGKVGANSYPRQANHARVQPNSLRGGHRGQTGPPPLAVGAAGLRVAPTISAGGGFPTYLWCSQPPVKAVKKSSSRRCGLRLNGGEVLVGAEPDDAPVLLCALLTMVASPAVRREL